MWWVYGVLIAFGHEEKSAACLTPAATYDTIREGKHLKQKLLMVAIAGSQRKATSLYWIYTFVPRSEHVPFSDERSEFYRRSPTIFTARALDADCLFLWMRRPREIKSRKQSMDTLVETRLTISEMR